MLEDINTDATAVIDIHMIYASEHVRILSMRRYCAVSTHRVRNMTLGAEKLRKVGKHTTTRSVTTNSRVVMSEDNFDLEDTTLVHTALRTRYGGVPAEEVVVGRGELDVTEILFLEVSDFTLYALERGLQRTLSDFCMDMKATGRTEVTELGAMARVSNARWWRQAKLQAQAQARLPRTTRRDAGMLMSCLPNAEDESGLTLALPAHVCLTRSLSATTHAPTYSTLAMFF